MSAEEIANKLWNLCNVLRDDGVTYHQYLNELEFLQRRIDINGTGLLEIPLKSKVKIAPEKCRSEAKRNGWGFEGQASRSF